MTSLLLHKWRIALGSAFTKTKESLSALRVHTRRALWRSRDGWRRLTAGMEIEELWTQFKAEAGESSRLYEQDVKERPGESRAILETALQDFGDFVLECSEKALAGPAIVFARHLILAFLSVIGFHFLLFTQEIEFTLAFAGLLVLLVLVLGDHVLMKRDIEIAREIQRWLVPRRAS